MRTLWCRITFRHLGRVNHNDDGIYWECSNCHARDMVFWRDTALGMWV